VTIEELLDPPFIVVELCLSVRVEEENGLGIYVPDLPQAPSSRTLLDGLSRPLLTDSLKSPSDVDTDPGTWGAIFQE
jgi:hypothetical protein